MIEAQKTRAKTERREVRYTRLMPTARALVDGVKRLETCILNANLTN